MNKWKNEGEASKSVAGFSGLLQPGIANRQFHLSKNAAVSEDFVPSTVFSVSVSSNSWIFLGVKNNLSMNAFIGPTTWLASLVYNDGRC